MDQLAEEAHASPMVPHSLATTPITPLPTTPQKTLPPPPPSPPPMVMGLPVEEMMDWMKCPICYNVPHIQQSQKILGCPSGHIICSSCLPKISVCPQCRSDNLGCRNLFAEKMYERCLKQVVRSCNYKTAGCTETDMLEQLAVHEGNCIYRTIQCPSHYRVGGCAWTGPMVHTIRHVLEKGCVQVRPPLLHRNESHFYSPISALVGAYCLWKLPLVRDRLYREREEYCLRAQHHYPLEAGTASISYGHAMLRILDNFSDGERRVDYVRAMLGPHRGY